MTSSQFSDSLEIRQSSLQAGMDLLEQGFTVFDEELRLVAWNKAFLDLLEFPPELAWPGAPFENFIRHNAERGEYGPGDTEAQIAERVAAAKTFMPHYRERARPNGRILGIRGEPLPDHGFITLYTDVTERRHYEELIRRQNADLEEHVRQRTEALEAANAQLREASAANSRIASALQRSEGRLRLITDTIPALIGYFDAGHIFRYANKGYSDWFRISNERIVGHPIPEVVGPQVYEAVIVHVQEALSGRQVSYEYCRDGQDGRPEYARSTLVPEFGPDGDVLGCFVLSFDVTEEKRTQAALGQAQKMEAIGQLSGGLAHDFNNLLTVVLGNLDALAERQGSNPELAEFIEPATQAARRGVELVKRLLTFSRQQPLAPRPVEVIGLVQDLARLIRRSLPGNITFSTSAAAQSLTTLADPHQLENAVLNLVFNARDALPNGGELKIESSLLTLEGSAASDLELPPGEYVQVAVSDNGMGMDGSVLARAFEPFFTTKTFGRGSGLGLSMVYGFAGQSGGGVRIRSRQARGTTVALLLPHVDESAVTKQTASHGNEEAPSPGSRLILLVDDDPEVRKIVRLQLTDLGYAVLEAENGPEAAGILEVVQDVSILLTDVVMPGGMDGLALARLARRQRPELDIILMSGYVAGGDVDIPGVPLLSKPFSRIDLERLLEACAP